MPYIFKNNAGHYYIRSLNTNSILRLFKIIHTEQVKYAENQLLSFFHLNPILTDLNEYVVI